VLSYGQNKEGLVELRDYLHQQRIKIAQMARDINVSRVYLNQITLKIILPSVKLAKVIELYTGGSVTAEELRKR